MAKITGALSILFGIKQKILLIKMCSVVMYSLYLRCPVSGRLLCCSHGNRDESGAMYVHIPSEEENGALCPVAED